MSEGYSEDEIENLPQTDTVFDRPKLEFDHHEWVQEGYMVRDVCNPGGISCENVGIPIPSGKLLVKTDGRYDLVDERRG